MNTDLEVWVDVLDYEGIYQASSFGRIKSFYFGKETIIKFKISTDGYYCFTACKNKIRKSKRVHILIATAFHNNPKNKPQVNHKDGIKTNNNYSNLEWCTQIENQIHAIKIGLQKSGEESTNSKLKNKDVLEIRKLRNKMTIKKIAEKYSVGKATINDIFQKRTWKQL